MLSWYVAGRLRADNHFRLRAGYLDERPRRYQQQESAFVLELLGEDASRLLVQPLQLRSTCGDGGFMSEKSVRAWVPFPEATRAARFLHHGVVVHELNVPRASPVIEILLFDSKIDDAIELTWEASHPENLPLEFFCRYSNDDGKSWHRIGWRQLLSSMTIPSDDLPGGDRCRLAIVATDGVNTSVATTDAFPVALKAFAVMIHSPLEGALLPAEQSLALSGQAYVLEERRPDYETLVWTSSLDGILGRGGLVDSRPLSRGEHVITLKAGEGVRSAHTSVNVKCE